MKDDGVSPLSTGLLLPDAVQKICDEGMGLRWDDTAGCYEVVDGTLFERRFDELRRKRERDDGSNGRPFSRMHKYYKLETGERWAKTGARFSPKNPILLRNLQAAHMHQKSGTELPSMPMITEGDNESDGRAVKNEGSDEDEPVYKRKRDMYSTDVSYGQPGFSSGSDSASSTISAENVKIKLRAGTNLPYSSDTFEVSLQAFLDAVSAGKQYLGAVQQYNQPSPATTDDVVSSPEPPMERDNSWAANNQMSHPFTPESEASADDTCKFPEDTVVVPPSLNGMSEECDEEMKKMFGNSEDLADVLDPKPEHLLQPSQAQPDIWGLWNENSKGDQAYFFPRQSETAQFFNGSIVMLKDGVLMPADDLEEGELYLVVSDKNAKWKGEPHPSKDQEHLGHWCAYLGQVPITIDGPVKAGQYLGPVGDGSGKARVVKPGSGPVVGIALESKGPGQAQIVKSMVSVGLNGLRHLEMDTPAAEALKLQQELDSASSKIAGVEKIALQARKEAFKAQEMAQHAQADVKALQHRVDHLSEDVKNIAAQQSNRKGDEDHEEILSTTQYLWSCFCGVFSMTVTETTSKNAPSQPQSVAKQFTSTCARYFDDLLNDTIVNAALTCALARGIHMFGLNGTFSGLINSFLEVILHVVSLLYLVKPFLIVGWNVAKHQIPYLAEFSAKPSPAAEAQGCGQKPQSLAHAFCPMMNASRTKFLVLFFWYAVAAQIAYTYAKQYETFAPFGYCYMLVLTAKSMYQVAIRSMSRANKYEDAAWSA